MNVLVVAAHPDDEILGCGATMARLAAEGHHVYIAILGEGITARYPTRQEADAHIVQALHDGAAAVAQLVGAKDLVLYGLPDNRFDSVPLLDVIKIVEELVDRFAPEVIYTHHSGDLNIDHTIVARAVLTGTRPLQNQPVREIYAFEVASSTEWAFGQLQPSFRPNVFEEITEAQLAIKVQALAYYESEARPFPHPRSPEAPRTNARRWGSVVGCGAVEPFELIRNVKRRGSG